MTSYKTQIEHAQEIEKYKKALMEIYGNQIFYFHGKRIISFEEKVCNEVLDIDPLSVKSVTSKQIVIMKNKKESSNAKQRN